MQNKKIFIIAGEASGDMHGAALAQALKTLSPSVKLSGMGGQKMRNAGVEILFESTSLAVTGFIEVLKHFKKFSEIFHFLVKKIKEDKPDAVILIDYPGFNLRLAAKIPNTKIFYYVSPQLWAWGKGRIKIIKRFIDKMIVLFKFEENFYRQFNVDAEFVGHPLIDIIEDYQKKTGKFTPADLIQDNTIKIALLPGSRENEVKHILPIMLKTAFALGNKIKNIKYLLAATHTVKKETYLRIIKKHGLSNIEWHEDTTYECLNACDFALVCSGTATLETALFLKPMAVIYKISPLSYLIIRSLIKVPYIGIINLIRGKSIVPEFIQFNARPKKIADYTMKVLTHPSLKQEIINQLNEAKEILGRGGASQKAAKIILENLSRQG